MADINFDAETPVSLEEKRMDLGLTGKVIGSGDQAKYSITLIIMLILLMIGTVNTFMSSSFPAGEFWKMILPIITLGLGYLFGQKNG